MPNPREANLRGVVDAEGAEYAIFWSVKGGKITPSAPYISPARAAHFKSSFHYSRLDPLHTRRFEGNFCRVPDSHLNRFPVLPIFPITVCEDAGDSSSLLGSPLSCPANGEHVA